MARLGASTSRSGSRGRVDPTMSPITLGLLIGLIAAVGGLVLAFGGPLAGAAVLVGGLVGVLVLRNMELGFWGVIAVICLLPFATLPVDIGLTPTFLDVAMGAVVFVWLVGLATGKQRQVVLSPVALPLVIFIIVAVFAFIFGLGNGPLTPTLLRKFAELLLSLGFVIVIVDYCRDWTRLERMVKAILVAGGAAAAVAIGLWLLPDDTANTLLNFLQRLGYPGGWVIRYIEENPALSERAIGTSIDPNSLGGLLLMMGALIGPQVVTRKPLFNRWITYLLAGLIIIALILTFSRGAMLGLVSGLGYVTLTRYRRLLPYLAVGGILLIFLPVTQGYIARFLEGFTGSDLATQMRFGEYKDALTLIRRYPLFGVGFAGTPDVDIYLGVANVYFTIAQLMGLFGLTAFFGVIGTVFGSAFLHRHQARLDEGHDAVWTGLHAALVGALVAGIFDHYLFNLEFHHAVTVFWMFIGLAAAATRLVAEIPTEAEV